LFSIVLVAHLDLSNEAEIVKMNVSAPQHIPHGGLTPEVVQRYLDENQQLIMAILENQNIGKIQECSLYQARLQQNLMMLASLADTHALTTPSSQFAAVPNQQNPNVFMSTHQHATVPTQSHTATLPQNPALRQMSRGTPQPRNVQQMNYPQGIQVVNGNFAQPSQIPQQTFVQNPVNMNPALVKQRSQTQPLPNQPHPLQTQQLQQPHMQQPHMQQPHLQQSHLQQQQQFQPPTQHQQTFVQNQPVTLNNLKTAVRQPTQPMMLKQPSQTLQQAPIIQQTPVIQQASNLVPMNTQQTTHLPVARPQVPVLPQQPKTQDFYRSQDMLRNYVSTQMQAQQLQTQQPMSQPMSPQGTPQMQYQANQGFPLSQQQLMQQSQNQRMSKQQVQMYQQLQQQQQQQKMQQLQQAVRSSQASQPQPPPPQPQPQSQQQMLQQAYAYQSLQSNQSQKAAQQLHSVLPADFMVNFQNSGLAESLMQQGNPEAHTMQNTFDSQMGISPNGQPTAMQNLPKQQEVLTQNFLPDNSYGMNSLGMEDDLGFSLDPNPQLFDTSNTINTDDYLL